MEESRVGESEQVRSSMEMIFIRCQAVILLGGRRVW